MAFYYSSIVIFLTIIFKFNFLGNLLHCYCCIVKNASETTFDASSCRLLDMADDRNLGASRGLPLVVCGPTLSTFSSHTINQALYRTVGLLIDIRIVYAVKVNLCLI